MLCVLRDRTAPRAGVTGGVVGDARDLETRIDEEQRAPRATTYQMSALDQLKRGEALTAMLHVERTRPATDGVFVDRGSVIVLERTTDWPAGAARDAVRTLVDPVWTKARLGLRWIDARIGTQSFSQLEGLETAAAPNAAACCLLPTIRRCWPPAEATSKPAVTLGRYAAGFRHARARLPVSPIRRSRHGGAENRE